MSEKNLSHPDGYQALFRSSPFIDLLGPVLCKEESGGWRIGLRLQEKHCNQRGLVHGGVLSSLADIALGYNAAFSTSPPTPLITANLNIDYVGSAKLDDWLEVSVDVQKVGRSMGFANAFFWVDGERIARANAVFKVA